MIMPICLLCGTQTISNARDPMHASCESDWIHMVRLMRTRLAEAEKDRDNLRGLFEHIAFGLWEHGCDIEFSEWQDESEERGLLVEVEADEDFKREYGAEIMFTWAWNDSAMKGGNDDG